MGLQTAKAHKRYELKSKFCSFIAGVCRTFATFNSIKMPFGTKKMKTAIIEGSTQAMGSLSLKNKTSVLVVDDNRVNRKIVAMMLSKLGVEVHEAEHGQEAVDLHIAGTRYDLILMDMESVMDRPEAARILRSMGIQCRVVGVTGNSCSSEKQLFVEAGINEYFEKPMTHAKLISLLGGA